MMTGVRQAVIALAGWLLVAGMPVRVAAGDAKAAPVQRQTGGKEERMSYLDNGAIRIGVNLDLGGAITYLSASGSDVNLINSRDWGRQIQMSHYSGPSPFTPGGKQPHPAWAKLGWNPIQSGDVYGNRSPVREHRNNGSMLYTKCVPLQWPLDDEPGECTFECWIRLEGATAQVRSRLVNRRSDTTQYRGRHQELPAVYTNGPWYRLLTYTGDKPFTGDALTTIPARFPWSRWQATENWAALVNDAGWGLGVWHPGAYTFLGGFAGKPGAGGPGDGPTGYVAPLHREIIDHDIEYEYRYVLILGSLDEIRRYVYAHAPASAPPVYRFEADRQHWHYANATDTGWPILGELEVRPEGGRAQLIGPSGFWPAKEAPKLYIDAAFPAGVPRAAVFWKRHDDPDFGRPKSVTFDVAPDGEYRVYEVDLASSPEWRGSVTGLRLDPGPPGEPGDVVRIRTISFQPPGEELPVRLTEENIHDATLRSAGGGEYEVRTTGPDPYVFTEPVGRPVDAQRRHVLAFEYFSTTGTGPVQVFLDPPLSEARSVTAEGLSHSEGWSPFAIDLKPALGNAGADFRSLRIDFGSAAGKVIRIRSLRLRPRTEQEVRLAARRAALRESEGRREARLRDYLRRAHPCRLTRVAVDDRQIEVEGEVTGERGALFLAEAPLYADVTGPKPFLLVEPIHPDAGGRFSLALARRHERGGRERDRLLSRWAVVRQKGDGYELLSHARYPDAVAPRADLPEEKPRNKKGLGALSTGRPLGDLDELGVSAATVNILLSRLLFTAPGPGRTPFRYAGRAWYSDDRQVGQLDATMREAAKRRLVVSAIVLVSQAGDAPPHAFGRLVAHPDADPSGIYVMPDVSSEQGLEAYAAALDFLAERYSRPDNRYGRIHHWILHNEVNAGWVWTNAGEKTALLYMDLYHKSLRAAHLIARQYDPHAKAFISLEHHWTRTASPKFYAGRDLLDLLADFSRTEGDFPWAVAYHPYPQNLFEPRVWEDTEARFTFDTPKITFKNLEVLDAWMKQPRLLYLGKHRRSVHLTEQGLNSRDYGETSLRDQAAGMAYAWNKYKDLDAVEVFHYHNWVDNRGEGGLRIGLRKFADDKDDPLGRKPIWFVYRALGTDKEAEATAPYKPVIGIRDWPEVRHAGRIR